MATISSPGIGSGLDVNGIVSQLVALEKAPLQRMQQAATDINSQISAFGQVQSLVSSLRTTAAALSTGSLWEQTTATSGDATAVGVTSSGGAAAGSYNVQVGQLAAAHGMASSAFTDATTAVGSGTLRVSIGSYASGSFVARSGTTPVDIVIDPGADSLQSIRDKINASAAGVTATIVRDATGARLSLRSKATGEENALQIEALDSNGAVISGGTGLDRLQHPPVGVGAAAVGMAQTQAGKNALATIDGIAIVSDSNTLANVLDGVTLTLQKTTVSPVALTVASDAAAMRTAVTGFVTAYNALNSYLATQTKYDDATKIAGSLQGDSTALALRNQFRTLVAASSSASGVFGRLSDIGFDLQRDGSISVKGSKLDAALGNVAEMSKLFTASSDSDPTASGFGVRMRQLSDLITGTDGPLTSRNEGLKAQLKRNRSDQERLNDRVQRKQEQLLRMYNALDTQLGQLNGLSSYVTAQMTALSKSSTLR